MITTSSTAVAAVQAALTESERLALAWFPSGYVLSQVRCLVMSAAAPWEGFRHGRVVLMSEWAQEDYASVERAGRELHARGWRKAFSLNEMLPAYESIVSRVEEGYDETVYEYWNDLACRTWLALAWPLVTENVRKSRSADLQALDDRFRAATTDDGGRSLGRFFKVEGGPEWWWRRRPVKVRGEFAADLSEDD